MNRRFIWVLLFAFVVAGGASAQAAARSPQVARPLAVKAAHVVVVAEAAPEFFHMEMIQGNQRTEIQLQKKEVRQ